MENKKLRVLLAEDNEVNQHLMERILSRMGYEAVLAKNGIQVLNKMDREDFDVILMDIQMPEMDGVTATKLIRGHYPPGKQPLIIALTAEIEGSEKYLAAGMDHVLKKPIQLEALEELLSLASSKTIFDQKTEGSQKAASALTDFQILDRQVLDDFGTLLAEETHEGLIKLIELFSTGTPVLIEKIETSADKKEAEEVLKHLHSLKGSCSQVGASRLQQLCARLETLIKQTGLDPFLTFIPVIKK
jgi:CheY-like chemotaxis protein